MRKRQDRNTTPNRQEHPVEPPPKRVVTPVLLPRDEPPGGEGRPEGAPTPAHVLLDANVSTTTEMSAAMRASVGHRSKRNFSAELPTPV